ncbi:pilus assembly protein [Cohnella faecalis]|uniref:Pilus assembly protein n=1 Tax=Cohnella faecalis TaxID=2315694 RepID=A0A398CJ91_9BACL|nr:pilus assembly protein [Cohnella faecalis]
MEAALVVPIFLTVAFVLVFLIQTSITVMALHSALSQTARQAASAWYPISLGMDKARDNQIYSQAEEWRGRLTDIGETIGEYGDYLPEPLKGWARDAADGARNAANYPVREATERWVRSSADDGMIDKNRIRITEAQVPAEDFSETAFLTLSAEYRLPFRIPFTNRPITIRETVKERAWIGGKPSTARLVDGEASIGTLSFVSLEPNPVRPGKKATLLLRGKPGEIVDLNVLYKSGPSEAKHLGSVTVDSSGFVQWTWHVSGRTTPGEWVWEAASGDGSRLKQTFQVKKRGANE